LSISLLHNSCKPKKFELSAFVLLDSQLNNQNLRIEALVAPSARKTHEI
jgi:hypothetical protein